MIREHEGNRWSVSVAGGSVELIALGWTLSSVCGWVHHYETRDREVVLNTMAAGMALSEPEGTRKGRE